VVIWGARKLGGGYYFHGILHIFLESQSIGTLPG